MLLKLLENCGLICEDARVDEGIHALVVDVVEDRTVKAAKA